MIRHITNEEREALFGSFTYTRAPTPRNREAIIVDGAWARKNIVKVPLDTFGIARRPIASNAWLHHLVVPHFVSLMSELRDLGLTDDIVTWNGSYNARLVRGSTTTLSNHAFGNAFDINFRWNRLGKPAAQLGEHGTVLRIVPVAEKHGWFWGGNFRRCDPMHFEWCGR